MKITFLPRYKQIEVEENRNLMQIMQNQQVNMDFVCGGNGTCGKCKVLITKGNQKDYTDAEHKCLTEKEKKMGYRLACEFTVSEDTCVILEEKEEKKKEEPKEQLDLSNGNIDIAFDIGTTTVEAVFLWNRETIVEKAVKVNPQRVYGLDIMSRISFAGSSKEHLYLLNRLILGALNEIIADFCRKHSVNKEQIKRIAVMGNTTMIYLLLRQPVKGLIKLPFEIEQLGGIKQAAAYGFFVKEECKLIVPPLIHSYIGSDTLGCILATGIWKKHGNYGIMDIGTNGEMVVSCDGKISVCSTAAGPAFEGANIIQGMRAQPGAIYKVERTGQREWEVYTIEDAEAKGICGSGLLDAVCVLRDCGLIDSAGFMREEKVPLDREGRVLLCQQDIRQFQLAKAAIYAGFKILIEEKGLPLDKLDKLYITGAFGNGLNAEHAMTCGLFPKIDVGRLEYVKNGSLIGAVLILQNEKLMRQAARVAELAQHVELAEKGTFRDEFIKNMDFYDK